MASERMRRIGELFEAAIVLAPEERTAFLNRECNGDEPLLRELHRLLRNDSDAGDEFLEVPAASSRWVSIHARDNVYDRLIGAEVASHNIKCVVARGGMGTVYLAEQAKPRRDVALKIMHGGFWSRSAERRFEFESQVLARLQHPNIAQVYEAGTAEVAAGVPAGRTAGETTSDTEVGRYGTSRTFRIHYFAMEYVPECANNNAIRE